jgi:Flp pilus assembly pilin Flp
MLWIMTTGRLKVTKWLRDFHKDRSGAGSVDNVMWIAVGALILVVVVSLVAVFWESIKNAVDSILGPGGGDPGDKQIKDFG